MTQIMFSDETFALPCVFLQDLYRTGSCRLLSPSDDRAALKRVLLGYARWNKEVGYCQVHRFGSVVSFDYVAIS